VSLGVESIHNLDFFIATGEILIILKLFDMVESDHFLVTLPRVFPAEATEFSLNWLNEIAGCLLGCRLFSSLLGSSVS
jgi:hypothetical protein